MKTLDKLAAFLDKHPKELLVILIGLVFYFSVFVGIEVYKYQMDVARTLPRDIIWLGVK